jgi:transketolase
MKLTTSRKKTKSMFIKNISNMNERLKAIKKNIVQIAAASKEGHIPSAFSILDILWVLYDGVLNINALEPDKEDRDRFILSKGHASLGLYLVLAEKGFISTEDLNNFGKYDSILGGHPDVCKVPGVEASTGSLGHGFPIAVGMALGMKIKKQPGKVYVIIGDGESNEGTIWESAFLAAHHNLSNLRLIIDHNHSTDRALKIDDLAEKFISFGWNTLTIDGHNHEEIRKSLTQESDKPLAIIAETIKGKGVASMENNPAWHHKFPTDDEMEKILAELS